MPRGKKTDAQIAAAREGMTEAAGRIIGQSGLSGLTARRLASELGCSVGSIYTYYRTLDQIVHAVNAETLDKLHEELDALLTEMQGAPVEEVAVRIADAYLAFAARHGERWAAIFDHVSPEPPPDWYLQKQAALFALAERALEPLAQGESAARAARALWAALYGVEGLSRAGHLSRLTDGIDTTALARDLVTGYLIGLAARESRAVSGAGATGSETT